VSRSQTKTVPHVASTTYARTCPGYFLARVTRQKAENRLFNFGERDHASHPPLAAQ
jgi:hypothetical protein